MNSSTDQPRRNRKRFLRQPTDSILLKLPAVRRLLSLRSLVLCCIFLTLLYLRQISSSFHPVLVVSSLSLLSSSSSTSDVAAEPAQDSGDSRFPLEIENRVLFPDHVLLLVKLGIGDLDKNELECVYYRRVEKVMSWDVHGFDRFRAVVRCPLPGLDFPAADVNLRWRAGDKTGGWMSDQKGGPCSNWDNVVYAAVRDGETAVIFVKGLNLRPGRVSDPAQFSCYFANRSGDYTLRTKALTAAQEILRCALPVGGFEFGVSVTVGVRGRPELMPSVARVSTERWRKRARHVLCACTMVWNQAAAMREWVMYHAWLGVQRWFVYDNNSDDGIDDVVREINRRGYNVTLHVWPWIKTQEAGFSHCALLAGADCDWVAFMDVDEFFHFRYSSPSPKHASRVRLRRGVLRDLVVSYSRSGIGEIRTTCHSFGPSGLTAAPPQGVTVGYTCRLRRPERHKSIVRLDALDKTLLNVVHHFRLKKGFKYSNLAQGVAIVNHYKYQVWEVFRAKFHRRVATYVADWQQRQNEGSRDRVPGLGTEAVEPPDWAEKFCEVYDSKLRDFVLANLVNSSTGVLPWEY